ncbi:MarR family winged helix-turn-helix transcriptional regulator [Kitasatospora sp. DSM 101779]|uniref:MarR family winged helix-turn-helix transcriptional regulator n=1 Tax=Kitasatospora sp. DSM 101779 TaxID=2853165 RepID=UPI0021DA719F|nr:MarR family transcriptional regulator [Kitasatospora sp. DSM 101779]MCU7821868.1 MarR family transcriptional regulator [Kitasatospora sp. DSM 101779]
MTMPIDQRLGHHIKRAEQELIAAKHAALRPFKLSTPQYTVLLVLSEEPGLSGAALARRCLVTPQTMSSVLGTLEGRGLVERKPHPIHQHILEARLTRSGRTLLAKADQAAMAVEQALDAEFDAEERERLLALLGRATAALANAPTGA